MRGLVLAWLVGLGLLTWRTAQEYHKPPVPGRLAGASVVFVLLALIAEAGPNAARTATITAWAFDLAVLLQIPPDQLTSTAGFGHAGSRGSTASTASATGPAGGRPQRKKG